MVVFLGNFIVRLAEKTLASYVYSKEILVKALFDCKTANIKAQKGYRASS